MDRVIHKPNVFDTLDPFVRKDPKCSPTLRAFYRLLERDSSKTTIDWMLQLLQRVSSR